MLDAVKRYATKVLLIHLALLILVICVVIGAARAVQRSAREEAQQQSKERLALLAKQTAGGLETHYDSILSDLDVILRNNATPATAPSSGAPGIPGFGGGRSQLDSPIQGILPFLAAPGFPPPNDGRNGWGGGAGGGRGGPDQGAGPPEGFQPNGFNPGQLDQGRGRRGRGSNRFGGFGRGPLGISPVWITPTAVDQLWRQLDGRVSQLFLVDTTMQVVRTAKTDPAWALTPEQIAREDLDWLKSVENSQMSTFKIINAGSKDAKGYHLIAVQASDAASTQPASSAGLTNGLGRRLAARAQQQAGEAEARGINNPPGGGVGRGFQGQGRFGPGAVQGRGGFRGGPGRMGGGPGGGFGGQGGFGPNGEPLPPPQGDFNGPPGGPGQGGGYPGFDGPPPGAEGQGGPGGFGPQGELPPGENPPQAGPVDAQGNPLPPHLVLVAVVPIDNVREFIDRLNTEDEHADSAMLINDNGDVLLSKNPTSMGSNLLAQLASDPAVQEQFKTLITKDDSEPLVLTSWYSQGGNMMPPQIVVASRLTVPSGHHWTVLISSPLSSVETLVNTIFHSALVWASVVTLSITGILVSTSFFMIRSRVRFERMRHEVLTRELQQARHIQLAWLPDTKSTPPGLEVSAANLPASHISGDFYNWFRLPPRAGDPEEAGESSRIAVVIGDVTGHGMAAAFLMATTQLLIRMTLTRYHDPGKALREVNRQLCTQSFKGQFVTMLVVVLDPAANTVEVATAGHPMPLVSREGGLFKELALEPQLVLGVDPDEKYTTQGFVLEPGASVLLYTDGVVEAEADTGEQYGVSRLLDLLNRNATSVGDGSAPERIRMILEDVKRFCGARELMDDVTLVALRTTPCAVTASAAQAAQF